MSVFEDLEVYTDPDQIRTWAQKPFIIGSLTSARYLGENGDYRNQQRVLADIAAGCCRVDILTSVTLVKYNNDGNRKIGWIHGILDDGSYVVSILGSGKIPLDAAKSQYATNTLKAEVMLPLELDPVQQEMIVKNEIDGYIWHDYSPNPAEGYANLSANIGTGGADSYLSEQSGVLYHPSWQPMSSDKNYVNNIFFYFGYMNGQPIGDIQYDPEIQLTDNENSTLTIGSPSFQYRFVPRENNVFRNGYANIGGALNGIEINEVRNAAIALDGKTSTEIDPYLYVVPDALGTYAGYYCPFNIPLTFNLEEAKNYLTTGELPSDCMLYPFDAENIPTNDSGETPDPSPVDPDTGGDEPDEGGGDPEEDTDPTPTVTPTNGPLALTNNNLYWLSSVELKDFITWFWTTATDIASVGDLWDKIKGLYENLAEAVLNVRYMPVDISWIGSLGTESAIVVGQIEKTQTVAVINKSMSPLRNLGTIQIPKRFNGGFANYSPYCSMSLWLPFHGFVELDPDLLMGKTLAVQCAYDILSGTIQYFIFRGGYGGQIINTITAKMAVDIPITLQTKNQRDSATFQNVASAAGTLIGAGASMAAGSPIGLTMAMGAFSGAQTIGAGLSVKGTVGESGAFYQPRKCAVYIKRPNYNRPDCYKSRVGYPCNQSKQLRSCKGFTQVYNPYVEFTHSTKPYKQEIDMIYEYLEKGVYL